MPQNSRDRRSLVAEGLISNVDSLTRYGDALAGVEVITCPRLSRIDARGLGRLRQVVDMVRKVQKKAAELLESEETVIAASSVTSPGQFRNYAFLTYGGGVIGALIGLVTRRRSRKGDDGTLAASFPPIRQAILVVTDRRWILFRQNAFSNSPRAIAATWPYDQIRSIDIESGGFVHTVCVEFSDGSEVQLEAVRAAKPQPLSAAAANLG